MNKPVIICIDDEPSVLESLKIELKRALGTECLIETAEGGEDALVLFEELLTDDCEVALVLSDYIMPDIKGDEVLKRIHTMSPNTLKIMLTGHANIEAVSNAIKYARLYRYIAKPWQPEDLKLTVVEAVHSYLQDKKLAEQNLKLQQMNQALAQLNGEQAILIAQLHDNESRLNQFLEAMPVGVFVVDAQGKPCYINQKAQQLLGKGVMPSASPQELAEVYQAYQAGTGEIYPQNELPLIRALHGESVTIDDLEIYRENEIVPLEVRGTPIYSQNGKIAYAIVAFQDITGRRKSELERERLIQELSELNETLDKALDAEVELTDAASRFVPNEFLSFLGCESIVDVKLGDAVEKEMSILFSDIRDFTTLSEQMTPEENFKFINSYLNRMEASITENNGFIDKYIGDAIMALFSRGADDAIQAAISMLFELEQYNQHRQSSGYSKIRIGLGINTGDLMLGIVGGQHRMDSTVISDAVNVAARVENLTKEYGVSLLVTHQTILRLNNLSDYAIRMIDKVQVKGKSELVTVYEVFDADMRELKEKKLATLQRFTDALSLYNLGDFVESAQLLEGCLRENAEDKVARIYLQRCERFLES